MSKFRGKFWCFTINNPTIEQLPPNVWPDVQYVIWQHEKGANGTEHIQGYVCMTKTKELSWLKGNCCYEAHWQPRMGSHSQAKHYCMKPVPNCTCKHCVEAVGQKLDGHWEHGSDVGIADGQGKRSDILACKEMLDNRATEQEVADAYFGTWSRNYKAFERYRRLKHGGARNWITRCTVYWGAPGIGKSKRARFEAGEGAYWLPQPEAGTVWWDSYDGQEVVVIDEFYGWMKRIMMQRLCDSTPLLVPNKGGYTPFLAKHIIVTSNQPPSQWWPTVGLGPMERRLTGEHGKVEHMLAPWVAPAPPPEQAPEQQQASAPAEMALPLLDLEADWAMFGTPPPEVFDSPMEDIHMQAPLQRCVVCHRMLELNGLCDSCREQIKWGGSETDHLQYLLDIF